LRDHGENSSGRGRSVLTYSDDVLPPAYEQS
jgi:hypothetical protein